MRTPFIFWLAAVLLAAQFILAQDNPLIAREWSRIWGSTSNEWQGRLAVDAAGYVYVSGDTAGSFDGQTNSGGGADAVLSKFDDSGDRLWTTIWGSSNAFERPSGGVTTYGTTAVFVAGWWPGATNEQSMFLTRFYPSGSQEWTEAWGGSGEPQDCICVGTSIFICGWTTDEWDGQTNAGDYDWFLSKLDTDGTHHWTRLHGTTTNDRAWAVCADSAGDIWVAGSALEMGEYRVAKWDQEGNALGNWSWGSPATWTELYSICADTKTNVYVVGQIFPDGGSHSLDLVKLRSDGTREWTNHPQHAISDVATGPGGNILISESSRLEGFSSDGDFLWGLTFMFGGGEQRVSSAVSGSNVYLVGVNTPGWEYDGQQSVGERDFCLTKWNFDYRPEFLSELCEATTNGPVVGWHGAWNCTFDVQSATNLLDTNAWAWLQGGTNLGGAELMSVTDSPPTDVRFYRVKATSDD